MNRNGSLQPLDGVVDSRQGVRGPLLARALDHHDGACKLARRDDFSIGRVATGVLGDDHIDGMLAQEGTFVFGGEGAARLDRDGMARQIFRRDGIDRPDQKTVRGLPKRGDLLAADGEEDVARRRAQGGDGSGRVFNVDPEIAGLRLPCGARQDGERHTRSLTGGEGVCRDVGRERMCGVDDRADGLILQVSREAVASAEAANAKRDRGPAHVGRSTGERQHGSQRLMSGEGFGQSRGLGGAAEDQYGWWGRQ